MTCAGRAGALDSWRRRAVFAAAVLAGWGVPAFGVVQSLPAATSGPTSGEVMGVLRRADEATRAVRSVRYRARARAEGALSYDVSGEVVLEGKGASAPERFNVTLSGRIGDGGRVYELTVVSDGQKYWLLDRASKTLDEVADPSALGPRYFAAMGLVLRELHVADPFGDEINAPRVESRGTRVCDGVTCDDVYVEYGANRKALWSIGPDGFPRRVEREFRRRGGPVRVELELTGLELNPALGAGEASRAAEVGPGR